VEEVMLLAGKTAVITGASGQRGIGLATAKLFAQHGARVAVLDLDETECLQASRALDLQSGPHIGLQCDVTNPENCRRAAKRCQQEFGRVDILIANAGVSQSVKVEEISSEDWSRIMSVNLTGVFNTCQAFIPGMRQHKAGSIVCMSSVSAQRGGGIFGGPHYSAAKAGVLGLAKATARELAPDGIRVNCITPGLVDTDITGGKLSDAARAEIIKNVPLGRLGAPEDIAGAYLFLASPLSSYITGAVLDVNGGTLIHG
jgi:NAD(P)-dependent dehydrogenase (short-subunit alcohol dehydrogenase family)